jgi:heme-degrading monooxygenase HmoA
MHRAYAYWSDDGQEVVGVSFWASKEACDAWRAGDVEARRREAMATYVVEEREAFYRGRELVLPAR